MTDHKRTYSQRGDDYLIEAQRLCAEDKPKPPVLCPYCGHKMVHQYVYGDHFFRCPKCRVASPDRDTEAEAYAAAMQRWQEPNRVLTLEEIIDKVFDAISGVPVWVEHINDTVQKLAWKLSGWQVVRGAERCVLIFETEYRVNTRNINKTWRCWLRKPTLEEMEAAPWGNPESQNASSTITSKKE